MAEADRTMIARAQIFPTTSQNMENEHRWADKGREKSNTVFLLHALKVAYAIPVNTLSPDCFLCIMFLLKTVISDVHCF
jgi:hypothetical protein